MGKLIFEIYLVIKRKIKHYCQNARHRNNLLKESLTLQLSIRILIVIKSWGLQSLKLLNEF